MSQDHERRQVLSLTDEQIEEIAERAAEKAVILMKNEFYQEVGKSIISRFLIIVGMAVVATVTWLGKDVLKS